MVRLGGLVGQARGSTGMLLICKKLGGRRVRREEGREGGKQREKGKGKDEIMDKGWKVRRWKGKGRRGYAYIL